MDMSGHFQRHCLGDILDGAGAVHVELGHGRFRLLGRSAEQPVEFMVGHFEADRIIEILGVDLEGTVILDINQVLFDQIDVFRFPVGSQPHQLIFAGINFESAVIGERGVEKTE